MKKTQNSKKYRGGGTLTLTANPGTASERVIWKKDVEAMTMHTERAARPKAGRTR